MTQEQTSVMEDLRFSVETQRALDDRARAAFNKISDLHISALKNVMPAVAEGGEEHWRVSQARTRASDVKRAQKDFMSLVEGRGANSDHSSAEALAFYIKYPLQHKDVQPSEIAPRFKGTKEGMRKLVDGQLGFYLVYSETDAKKHGSCVAEVKGEDGTVKQVSYSAVFKDKNWRNQCGWPDALEVYSAPSELEAGFRPIRGFAGDTPAPSKGPSVVIFNVSGMKITITSQKGRLRKSVPCGNF